MSFVYDSLSSASKKLMFKEPFYGMFLISLNKDISTAIETACVSKNGINVQLTVNPNFWEKELDDASRIGVLKHELLHIVFFHLNSWDEFVDKELANIAADLEVNQYISQEYKGPKWVGIELKNYPELKLPEKAGIREYYKLLDKINQQRQGQQGQGKQGQGQGQGQQGQGQQGKDQNQQGQGQGQQDKQQQGGGGGGQSKNDGSSAGKSKIWDIYDNMKAGQKSIYSHELWKEFMDGLSEAERKLIQKQIDHQLKEIASSTDKSRGLVPAELKDYIDGLFKVEEPVVDWKEYLRRFVGHSNKIYTKKTRRKLNKRFIDNPALKIKTKKTLLVARDTSGSTSKEDHLEFFNELHHIYKTGVKVFIVDADAGVADVFEYKGTPPDHISGRGGTDFDPAIKYYNENKKIYNNLIYLTDGQCGAPSEKPYNGHMMWVISSGGTLSYSKDYPGIVVQIKHKQ